MTITQQNLQMGTMMISRYNIYYL